MPCLIFDCDGTLVDSELLGHRALATRLREIGVEEDAEDLSQRYRGFKLQTLLDDLRTRHRIELPESFVADYRSLLTALFESELQAVPHVKDALTQLSQAKCVASSGPRAKIAQALRVAGLAGHFGANLFSSYEVGSWKPEPGIFLAAAQGMGFAPEDCIVIEDSPVGIEAAKAAKMRAFWFDPGRERPYDVEAGVTAFGDMAELPTLLALR